MKKQIVLVVLAMTLAVPMLAHYKDATKPEDQTTATKHKDDKKKHKHHKDHKTSTKKHEHKKHEHHKTATENKA